MVCQISSPMRLQRGRAVTLRSSISTLTLKRPQVVCSWSDMADGQRYLITADAQITRGEDTAIYKHGDLELVVPILVTATQTTTACRRLSY